MYIKSRDLLLMTWLQSFVELWDRRKLVTQAQFGPDAVGVLPVCLGRATKLCGMLTDKDKVYEAVMLLGVETDTQDTTGRDTKKQ